jgi:hypothetical protein
MAASHTADTTHILGTWVGLGEVRPADQSGNCRGSKCNAEAEQKQRVCGGGATGRTGLGEGRAGKTSARESSWLVRT